MLRNAVLFTSAFLLSLYVGMAQAEIDLPIIPGSNPDLFGMTTPAGSGRNLDPPSTTVCKVVTLSDTGSGQDTDGTDGVVSGDFRYCVETAPHPKTVIFEVGGAIELKDKVVIPSYTTIAGQTAPSPGITLINSGLEINPSSTDILVQHLKIRPGDKLLLNDLPNGWSHVSGTVYSHSRVPYSYPWAVFYNWQKLVENDGATAALNLSEWDEENGTLYVNVGEDPALGRVIYAPGKTDIPKAIRISDSGTVPERIVIDHCSLTSSADMNVNIGGNYITIMNSIISDALGNPLHPKGPHSKGIFVNAYQHGATGGQYVAIVNNLISHQVDRNPEIDAGYVVVANNYIYDTWQALEVCDDDINRGKVLASFVGNYIEGTEQTAYAPYIGAGSSDQLKKANPESMIYLGPDNYWSGAVQSDPWSSEKSTTFEQRADLGHSGTDVPPTNRASNPSDAVWPGTYSPMTASEAKAYVLLNAGARPQARDRLDTATVAAAASGETRGRPIYQCVSCSNSDCVGAGTPWQCCSGVGAGSCPDVNLPKDEAVTRELTIPDKAMEVQASGYTALEEWLHGFASAVEAEKIPAPSGLRVLH